MPHNTSHDIDILFQPGALEGDISSAELELIESILPDLLAEMLTADESGEERDASRALRSGLNDTPSGE